MGCIFIFEIHLLCASFPTNMTSSQMCHLLNERNICTFIAAAPPILYPSKRYTTAGHLIHIQKLRPEHVAFVLYDMRVYLTRYPTQIIGFVCETQTSLFSSVRRRCRCHSSHRQSFLDIQWTALSPTPFVKANPFFGLSNDFNTKKPLEINCLIKNHFNCVLGARVRVCSMQT